MGTQGSLHQLTLLHFYPPNKRLYACPKVTQQACMEEWDLNLGLPDPSPTPAT